MLIKEWGYVLVAASCAAVFLFCWLSFSHFTRFPRKK